MGIGRTVDTVKNKKKRSRKRKVEEEVVDDDPQLQKEMREKGEEFVALDEQIKELNAKKRALGDELLPYITASCEKRTLVIDEKTKLVAATSSSKRPTKKLLVEEFGDEGKDFWDALEPSHSEYISIKKEKA